jgi:hypothetical protein
VGRWRFALQNRAGQTLTRLGDATERRFEFPRDAPYVFSFRLDHESRDAYQLFEQLEVGLAVVRGWRSVRSPAPNALPPIRYAGIVTGIDEDTETGITVTCENPLAWLMFRLTNEIADYAGIDAGQIVADLVTKTQQAGSVGITLGSIIGTVGRDVTYEHSVIGEVIGDLAGIDQGIGIELDPIEAGPVLASLRVFPAVPALRKDIAFGYGAGTVGNVLRVSRKWLPPRNSVRVLGAESLWQEVTHTQSIAKYGLWQVAETMPDTIELDMLQARGYELLTDGWRRVVTFDPDPLMTHPETGELLTPDPFEDYWLGDYVPLTARKGALQVDNIVRIDGINIDLNDDGDEAAHELIIPENLTTFVQKPVTPL